MDAEETVNHFEAILRSEGREAYDAAVSDLWRRNPRRAAALGLPEPVPTLPTDSLENLLRIVADPKASASILKALKERQEQTASAVEKLAADTAELNKAKAVLDDREKALATREKAAEATEAREIALAKQKNDAAALAAELSKRKSALDERENAQKKNETVQRNTAAALDKRAADLAAAEKDYNGRIANLRKLVG